MTKVFVSNWNDEHDYSSAALHGQLTRVTSGNYPIFKTLRLQEEIARALQESKPDDFLLLSGSSLVAGLCMTSWMFLHGRCKILLLDRRENGYVTRLITKSTLQLTNYRDKSNEFAELQRGQGDTEVDSADDGTDEGVTEEGPRVR